jgi:hypothetical protein
MSPPHLKAAASIVSNANDAASVSVATLVVGTGNVVTKEDQLGGGVTITGTLTGALAAGAVEIILPDGQTQQATVGADGVSFSLTVTAYTDLYDFAVANTVSAYVAGNPDAAVT